MTRKAPGTSKPRARSSRLSGTYLSAPTTATAAIGTLTKNTQRQEAYSVRTPPRIRPRAAPPAVMAAQMPRARLRSSPSSKTTVISDSAAGDMSAPPRPCTGAGGDEQA